MLSIRKRASYVRILRAGEGFPHRQRSYEVDHEIGQRKEIEMKVVWAAAAAASIAFIASGYATKAATFADGKFSDQARSGWRDHFDVNKADLLPTGSNAYITMQPGRVLSLAHGNDTLTVSVLPDTQEVDGVTAGVLEERETKNGKLIEVSRNFLATDKNTGDVYYFGEDVDNYKNGKIVDHDSAWRAGTGGASFGLMIPAKPTVGQRFYQEIAPKVAMDRVEVVSTNETVKTPAGTFEHCVHLRETTPLERDVSHKYYAPGVGIIKDDEFELVKAPVERR
jgi:hypothetical protein